MDDFFIKQRTTIVYKTTINAGGFQISSARVRRYSTSPDLSPIRRRSISPEGRRREVDVFPWERFKESRLNYTDTAEKNAQELIEEEEHTKMKADRKKAKKARQRQKKMESKMLSNKSENNETNNNNSNAGKNTSPTTDNKELEGLDLNAAFISKAVKKAQIVPIIPEEPKQKNGAKDINSIIKMALECEKNTDFKKAVQYFSEALILSPNRFDLLLKRSLIYYQVAKFEKSVRDAQKVLEYSPNNPDGRYRLGEAYFALNNLPEAESSFIKLLNINSYSEQAKKRLFSIRLKQLEIMGYHPNEAFTALLKSKNKTLDEAIEYLTALETGKEAADDLYYSDEDESDSNEEESDSNEDESEKEYEEDKDNGSAHGPSPPFEQVVPKPIIVIDKKSPLLTDSTNPLDCCSLFVGNLKKNITYEEVYDVFIKFGDIKNIKLVTEPNCYSFINYTESSAAGSAMQALQSSRWLLSTEPLIIKFPINAINSYISNLQSPELILNKIKLSHASSSVAKPTTTKQEILSQTSSNTHFTKPLRPRPPPNTEECLYWRRTGCIYGDKCFNLHIPEHEGVENKTYYNIGTNLK